MRFQANNAAWKRDDGAGIRFVNSYPLFACLSAGWFLSRCLGFASSAGHWATRLLICCRLWAYKNQASNTTRFNLRKECLLSSLLLSIRLSSVPAVAVWLIACRLVAPVLALPGPVFSWSQILPCAYEDLPPINLRAGNPRLG